MVADACRRKAPSSGVAKEIIRRTDSFFTNDYVGDNKAWSGWVRETVGMPCVRGEQGEMLDAFIVATKEWEDWCEDWGALKTNYVSNDWISSSYLFGPHGWCHPDGNIGFSDNIGKYPSAEEILDDWQRLADAFPELDLVAVLMSGESCEEDVDPLVGIRVCEGKAWLVEPEQAREQLAVFSSEQAGNLKGEARAQSSAKRMDELIKLMKQGKLPRGCGIPREWITEWAEAQRENKPSDYSPA